MASAQAVEKVGVSIQDFFNVITQYEKYPEFLQEMTETQIVEEEGNIKIVNFNVTIIKPVTYTLKIEEVNAPYEIKWSLVESDAFKVNNGGWNLKELSENEIEATYYIECDFKIFVPSIILNKIVSAQLPKMLHAFKEHAESL
ncbi:MAG: hypothetical protein HYW47_05450 [Deltaproteobacteria bacterium]|nr:hypothetical protein [Deltaproteobacteria bacterium]